MNQSNIIHAEIFGYLAIALYSNNIFSLESMDTELEVLLNGKVYDLIEASANIMILTAKGRNIKNETRNVESEIKSLKDYKFYTMREIEKYKISKKQLLKEIKEIEDDRLR